MSALRILLWVSAAAVMAPGCGPTPQQRDQEVRLHKAEEERNSLRRRLSDEQTRAAAQQERLVAVEAELKAARAQVAALTEQVDKLTQRNRELQAPLEELKRRELKRPQVPASPLPEKSDAALAALAAKLTDRMWYDRGRGAVSFANDRLFDSGSDVVRTDALAALRELAGILAAGELADFEVIVVGHTDSSPITKPETLAKHPSNWHLAAHRAIAVKDVLVGAGLPAGRVGIMGYADNRPVSDNPAQNRRVEIFVVPKGVPQPFEPVRPTGK